MGHYRLCGYSSQYEPSRLRCKGVISSSFTVSCILDCSKIVLSARFVSCCYMYGRAFVTERMSFVIYFFRIPVGSIV